MAAPDARPRTAAATLSRLAQRAQRTQMGDPAFRAELAKWTAVADDQPDGVPASAGGPLTSPTRHLGAP
jgi:hypothetical protein